MSPRQPILLICLSLWGVLYLCRPASVCAESRVYVSGSKGFLQGPVHESLLAMLKNRGFVVSRADSPQVIQVFVDANGAVQIRSAGLERRFRIPSHYREKDIRARAIILFLEFFLEMKQRLSHTPNGRLASPMPRPRPKPTRLRPPKPAKKRRVVRRAPPRKRRVVRRAPPRPLAPARPRVRPRPRVVARPRPRPRPPVRERQPDRRVVPRRRLVAVVRPVVERRPDREVVEPRPAASTDARQAPPERPSERRKPAPREPERRVAMTTVEVLRASRPPWHRSSNWWLGLEAGGGVGLGVSVQNSYTGAGVVSPAVGGRVSLIGGWRWLSLRGEIGGYSVPDRDRAGVGVFRFAGLLGVAPLQSVVTLRFEVGGFGELFGVTSEDGSTLQFRGGLTATVRLEWTFTPRWTVFFAPAYLFSPREIPFLRRGQLLFQADHSVVEFMIGIRFEML